MCRRAAIGCWLALLSSAACGDTRLIGRNCPETGCPQQTVPLEDCGMHLSMMPIVGVAAGGEIDRCELFTLDALKPAGASGHVYLSGVEATKMPAGHHLDVRIAPKVTGFDDDGPVDCMELWSRAIAWVPLMATQGTSDPNASMPSWNFADAPLVTAPNQRLLIDHHFTNLSSQSATIQVAVDVHCAAMVPSRVSQAFEFSDRAPHVVSPGSRQVAGGRCPFEKEVLVSRLYRWTHLITSYSVWQQLKESEPLLWQSDSHWVLDFPPPFLHFSAGEGFRWECVYDNTGSNTGDQAFQIGGTSSDACSLLGIYQLVSPVSGAEDDSPERCTR